VGRLAEGEAMDLEAQWPQRLLEHVEHFAARRRYAWTVDQALSKRDGVDCNGRRLAKDSEMPKVDLDAITPSNATGYPDPFHKEVQGCWCRRVAPADRVYGLGARHVTLNA